MSTVVAEQGSIPSTPAAAIFARRGTLAAVAGAGFLVAAGGALLIATSGHLADPVAFAVQLTVMVVGTVGAALLWLVRRPGNLLGSGCSRWPLRRRSFLQGAAELLLHSLGVAIEPIFFLPARVPRRLRIPGRPTDRQAGAVAAQGDGAHFLTGFVPYLFFSPVVQGGAPLAGCNAACPTNTP